MKTTFLFLLLLFSIPFATQSQDSSMIAHFLLGGTIVSVEKKCFNNCSSQVLFLNLHDDENTSVTAAEYTLCEKGGSLVRIQNCEERLISFSFNQEPFLFDPNRIYSQEGITSNLKLLSARFDSLAANEVSAFAYHLLTNYINGSRLIIALHNNRDKELSVLSYQKDQAFKKHSGKVFLNSAMDPDDFILTTDSAIYSRLAAKNINVIWENVDSTKDDGSLSIYAGRHRIPYINVEAQHDHIDEQVSMLSALEAIIKEYETAANSSPHPNVSASAN